jgi:hypothetical protein
VPSLLLPSSPKHTTPLSTIRQLSTGPQQFSSVVILCISRTSASYLGINFPSSGRFVQVAFDLLPPSSWKTGGGISNSLDLQDCIRKLEVDQPVHVVRIPFHTRKKVPLLDRSSIDQRYMIFLGLEFDYIFYGSWTLILQSSFHIWLVSMAASTQALITLGSSEQPEQPEQLLRSPTRRLFCQSLTVIRREPKLAQSYPKTDPSRTNICYAVGWRA